MSVSGHVRTPAGAPVAGATVSGGQLITATTDATGFYRLQFLAPGTYTVTATAEGMDSSSKLVALTIEYTNATEDFSLRWLTSTVLNREFVTTAAGPFDLIQTLSTYAPATSCANVTDSRTGVTASLSLTAGGPASATGSWTASLPAGSSEGTFTLTAKVTDCASGIQIDVGSTPTYVIDNTPPRLVNPIPALWGNSTTRSPRLSVHATDAGSGVVQAGALILDEVQVPVTLVSVTPAGSGAVIAYDTLDLSTGPHEVSLDVMDRAGNAAETIAWTFVVTTFAGGESDTLPDPARPGKVPVAYTPGQLLDIEGALQVATSGVGMAETGHPGFGLVCGSLDLSGLRAKFTKVDGTFEHVAPQGLGTTVQHVCSWAVASEPDTIEAQWFQLIGRSYALNPLSFPIPLGAMPLSTVPLEFNGAAPKVRWQSPCVSVNAAPGYTPPIPQTVCDPLTNWLDVDAGTGLYKDRQSRLVEMGLDGWQSDGLMHIPSVWSKIADNWALPTPPVDVTRVFESAPLASAITAASPYAEVPAAPVAVLMQTRDQWVREGAGDARETLIGSSFRWSSTYDGDPASTHYLAEGWGDGFSRVSVARRLWDDAGSQVAADQTDSGAPVSWVAFDDPEWGAAVGWRPAFASGGETRVVRAGTVDVVTTDTTGCIWCPQSSQFFALSGSSAGSFERRTVPAAGLLSNPVPSAELEVTTAGPLCGLGTAQLGNPQTVSVNMSELYCSGGGNSNPDDESGPPVESDTWYVTLSWFQSAIDHPKVLCDSGNLADLDPASCDVPYSLGYYADRYGHQIFFVGRPCAVGNANGEKGVSVFGTCVPMQQVVDVLKVWHDGYVANSVGHAGVDRVRFTLATNNSHSLTNVPRDKLAGHGRNFYDKVMRTVRPHAKNTRGSNGPAFRTSGGMDVETPLDGDGWRGAADTKPWVEGFNAQADATFAEAEGFKANMYAVSSLAYNYPDWTSPSPANGDVPSNAWTAQDYFRVLWGGKGDARFDEDYSIPQNYSNNRPEYYATLNVQASENADEVVYHSGVAWGCNVPDISASRQYAGTLDSFQHFNAVVQPTDAAIYRVLVHDLAHEC